MINTHEGHKGSEIAAVMHDLSIHLWNAYWSEHGEDFDFPEREAVEQVQGILNKLAWPRTDV